MAFKASKSSAPMNRIFEKHLQCSICEERFNQPKALNCMHSFCQKCLVSYYKEARKMPCPICREETQLPVEGVSGLNANIVLEGLLDDVSSLVIEDETPEHESRCNKHKGGIKLFYCVPCKEQICRDCTVIDHRENQGHHYIDCKTAALERRQKLKDVFPDSIREIKLCQRSLKISSKAKQKFGQTVARVRTEVHSNAVEIILKVRVEEDRILTKIKTLERDRNAIFDENEKTVSRMLQEKQYNLEVANDVVKNTSDSTFLELYPVMTLLTGQSVPQIDLSPSCLRLDQSETSRDINLGKLDLEEKWEVCKVIGGFLGAYSIAPSALHDDFAVTEVNGQRVVMINNGVNHKKIIQIDCPWGIAAIKNQFVVVDKTMSVKMYNEDGTLAFDFHTVPPGQVGKTAVRLQCVAVKKYGTILVGDLKRQVITHHNPTDGSLLRTIQLRTAPHFLAIYSNDRVVVSGYSQQKVDIIDENGAKLFIIKPTINGHPVKFCTGVCCDSTGIYIAMHNKNTDTGHIHHYGADGTFVSCIVQGLFDPRGISFTSDGQALAVADLQTVKMYHKV